MDELLGRSYRTRRENRSGSNSSAIVNPYKRLVGRNWYDASTKVIVLDDRD